ncbi:unnamed protein product [Symbiodinium microadriaticum]|nr:unnamed protein product [Symbiodinium microadriaticum]
MHERHLRTWLEAFACRVLRGFTRHSTCDTAKAKGLVVAWSNDRFSEDIWMLRSLSMDRIQRSCWRGPDGRFQPRGPVCPVPRANRKESAAATSSSPVRVMLAASAFVMRRHLKALGALRNHQGRHSGGFLEEQIVKSEAHRLRREADQLEQEQEQARAATRMLDLVTRDLVEHKPRILLHPVQPSSAPQLDEHPQREEARRESRHPRSSLASATPLTVRMLAMLPYFLPMLDALRFFGAGLASEHLPSYYLACTSVLSAVPQDLRELLDVAQPLLLFAMPTMAVRRQLPELLRFNLNQAFLLDLATCMAFHLSSFTRWMTLQSETAFYVPAAAEPPLMPFSCASAAFSMHGVQRVLHPQRDNSRGHPAPVG